MTTNQLRLPFGPIRSEYNALKKEVNTTNNEIMLSKENLKFIEWCDYLKHVENLQIRFELNASDIELLNYPENSSVIEFNRNLLANTKTFIINSLKTFNYK